MAPLRPPGRRQPHAADTRLAQHIRTPRVATLLRPKPAAPVPAGERRRAIAALSHLPAPVIYGIALVFDKALSFFSIPYTAHYLSPNDYGSLDIALSLMELCAIVLALAVSDSLIRFAGTATDPEQRKKSAAELVGTILPITIGLGFLAQLAVPTLMQMWSITLSEQSIRASLLAATLSGFLEMPLTWIRMQDRPLTYFAYSAARSCLNILLLIVTLRLGGGADGWLTVSSLTSVTLSIIVTTYMLRETGICFSFSMLHKMWIYALPIMTATLASYALSTLSRPILAQTISPAEIAQFTIAARLATITSLLLTPFTFWWGPKRLAVMSEVGGLQRSADIWGIGLAVSLLASILVAQLASLFVAVALPTSYAGSVRYIAPMVAVFAIGHVTWLAYAGVYARSDGMHVLAIEFFSAAFTMIGYILLVSRWGIPGAIVAMLIGQSSRLLMAALSAHSYVPIPYPWPGALLAITVAIAMTAMMPQPDQHLARALWAALSVVTVTAILLRTGVLKVSLADVRRAVHNLRQSNKEG